MELQSISFFFSVLWIRRFSGLPDPHPEPLVTSKDPDPSIIKQNSKKNLDFFCFVTFYDFLPLFTSVPDPDL
jgi:hypothetical protein